MSGEHRDVVVGSVSVAGPRRERLTGPECAWIVALSATSGAHFGLMGYGRRR
jgi:hypothetical protein